MKVSTNNKILLVIIVLLIACSLGVALQDPTAASSSSSIHNTFTKTLEEKHLDCIFYSDDFTPIGWTKNFAQTGILFKETKDLAVELSSFKINRHVLVVRLCQNSTSFFRSISQISNSENYLNPSTDWRPIYYIVWPYQVVLRNNDDEAESIFQNKILPNLTSIHFSIDSNIYIVIVVLIPNTNVAIPYIWEYYCIGNNTVYRHLPPMDWYDFTNKMKRRSDFHGSPIKVMTADDDNYADVAKFRKGIEPPEFESGTSVSLLAFMKDRLNFTISAVKGNWTEENEEGEVSGGVLEMEQGIADLCISQTPKTPKREAHIHFLQPTFLDGLRAYFIQPSASSYRNIYSQSFTSGVWLALLAVWIILLSCIHFFSWIKNKIGPGNDGSLDERIVEESFLWALGATCQQGWHTQPTSFSMRLIFLIGYLKCVICFVAFSASIVSTLSVKPTPFKRIQDLEEGGFRMFVVEHSTAIVFLKGLLQKQKNFQYILNESMALTYLQEPHYTLITYPSSFRIMTSKSPELYTPQFICDTFTSFAIGKGSVRSAMMVPRISPYKEFLNYQIIVMRERGINYRFFCMYVKTNRAICLDFKLGQTQSLGLEDVQSAFFILLIGHFLSLFIVALEYVSKCKCVNIFRIFVVRKFPRVRDISK